MSNKNDLEIAKIYSSTEKFHTFCDVVKHGMTLLTILGSIFLIFIGLKPFLAANPEAILAIAGVLDKLNFSNMFSYFLTGTAGTAWYIERKGKKRAIKEKGKYQKIIEKDDEYRSSSGLTRDGQTPKRREK